jgi:hypothetical protein
MGFSTQLLVGEYRGEDARRPGRSFSAHGKRRALVEDVEHEDGARTSPGEAAVEPAPRVVLP